MSGRDLVFFVMFGLPLLLITFLVLIPEVGIVGVARFAAPFFIFVAVITIFQKIYDVITSPVRIISKRSFRYHNDITMKRYWRITFRFLTSGMEKRFLVPGEAYDKYNEGDTGVLVSRGSHAIGFKADSAVITDEMGVRLVDFHEALNGNFIQKHNPDAENRARENIAAWFVIINRELAEIADCSYDDAQETLLEIAAFLGEQLRKDLGGDWRHGIEKWVVIIGDMNTLQKNVSILNYVVGAWKTRDITFLREYYYFLLDGKLPVSSKRKKELHKRLKAHF